MVLAMAHFSSMGETTESKEEDAYAKPGELKDHPGREFLANEYSCGISLVINREESKGPASVGQYPWLVLLGYTNIGSKIIDYKCGGTLIGSRFVVTSAECVKRNKPSIVRAVEHNQATLKDCGHDDSICSDDLQDILVEKVIIHPRYKDKRPQKHNIALIKLAANIKENDFVSSICMYFEEDNNTHIHMDAAGWGSRLDQKRKRPSSLRFSEVKITSSENCPSMLSGNKKNLCITALNGQVNIYVFDILSNISSAQDLCLSDSGGVLMRNIQSHYGEQWFLMGVGAEVMSPARAGVGVYTSLPAMQNGYSNQSK
jgi:secreted trypsin-like serine protease